MMENYRVSLHNHTIMSDGADTAEDMIKAAVEKGFTHFAITDHCCTYKYEDYSLNPSEYDAYVDVIEGLREKYADKIEVLVGIETERYGDLGYMMSDVSSIRKRLDFLVGSVHTFETGGYTDAVDEERVKFSGNVKNAFSGSGRALVENYFENYIGNINELKPEIAGHLDLVKKNNLGQVFFDESSSWYRDLVHDALDTIRKNDCVMEINTGGAYKHGARCIYPDTWIIRHARDMNIRITMGSDAHSTDMIGYMYNIVLHRLKMCGVDTLYAYSRKNGEFIPFSLH